MSTDTINRDMIEELAASLSYAAEKVMEHLGDVQAVDPDDLVTELEGAPRAAEQAMDALSQLAALGREADELRQLLDGMGF